MKGNSQSFLRRILRESLRISRVGLTIIEGKVMSFNGPSLAVNLMEGQSAETADTASVHE